MLVEKGNIVVKENIEKIEKLVLSKIIEENGFKKYRLTQIFDGINNGASDFKDINNIPKKLISFLEDRYYIEKVEVYKRYESKIDSTKKYLLKLHDNNIIEAVLMEYKYGLTTCISSQVGCLMGCEFCASGLNSKIRDLSFLEMKKQIKAIEKDVKQRISNVVVMGSGEPFDNFDNIIKFIHKLNEKNGLNIGQRHITISTCGIVDKIYKFADLNTRVNLAISLHSANQEKRMSIMPIAKKYTLSELKKSIEYYVQKTNRKVSLEYALIDGFNDGKSDLEELIRFADGKLIYVNLIPINPIPEKDFKKPMKDKIYNIQNFLIKNGINATVRREMGSDISGACGQLRISEIK